METGEQLQELRDIAVSNSNKLDFVRETVGELRDCIFGNGGPGLLTRIEVLERVEQIKYDGLRSDIEHQGKIQGIRVKHVKEGSIDWKFIATLLINAVMAGVLIIKF